MGFARTFQDGEPACTKTVTVRLNGVAIKLKQNRQILVNGEDVTKLPMYAGGARLRIVSSIFVAVDLPNGLGVLWDGVSRVYVNAPPQFRGMISASSERMNNLGFLYKLMGFSLIILLFVI